MENREVKDIAIIANLLDGKETAERFVKFMQEKLNS